MLQARVHKLIYGPHRAGRNYKPLNRIELSRSAMLDNVHLLQLQHPDFSIMPVLKANAYGHGLEEAAEILNTANCDLLAVDGYFEAAKIRYITNHRILVLGYIKPENVPLVDTKRCSFVVQDIAGLSAFGHLRRPVRIHLELNTGMNRLGLRPEEVTKYLLAMKRYPNLELEGIMTHLADADNTVDNSFTKHQIAVFDRQVENILSQGLKPKFLHIAQTAGSVKVRSRYANSIRLGIGLYGISPLAPKDRYFGKLKALQPVLELKSTIIKTISLEPGDKVSYNGIFTADKTMRIGVLPLGYYEGIPRELSNAGCVTSGNEVLPIAGRICMNHTMINLMDSKLKTGDEVTVFSADPAKPNSIARLAVNYDLFSYSLLTGLSSSIRRVVIG